MIILLINYSIYNKIIDILLLSYFFYYKEVNMSIVINEIEGDVK